MGDVLVAPLVNGQPNLADCSPTNNTVFARTYDLNIGGWGILSRIGATDVEADAYMAIQLEYEKPDGGAQYHYNVWIQGEKADEASQKLGKNLQCRGSSYSETFSQVSAMINAYLSNCGS